MIYSIFLYNYRTGIILSDVNFHDISEEEEENLSFLGSFISAINSFFSGIISRCNEQKHRMKLLHIGDYCIKAYVLFPKLNIDLIAISDLNDNIDNQIGEIREMLFEYYDLFANTNQNKTREFTVVEIPIIEILRKWSYTMYFANELAN